jgi:hypothetical protein
VGNISAEQYGSLNPFGNGGFYILDGIGVGYAIGHAARKFRHLRDVGFVFFIPVDDQLIFMYRRSPYEASFGL